MRFQAAVKAAAAKARKTNRFFYVCKDRMEPEDQYEVCSESDVELMYGWVGEIHEVDADGLVGESA